MASIILEILKLPLYFLLEIFYFVTRSRPLKELSNRDVLITGAAQGIGAEFARQFAAMGNRVHLVDMNSEKLHDFAQTLTGCDVHTYTCDLSRIEQVEQLYRDVTDSGFTITVLINNAGIAFFTPLTDMSLTQIQHSATVNMTAAMWLIKLFLPKMLELDDGHVVNIASIAGFQPLIRSTDYCAVKAGSIHMMEQLRSEHYSSSVQFTAVCPWFVDTRMIDGLSTKAVRALSPKQVVTQSIRGVREGKNLICVPRYINFGINLLRFVIPKSIAHELVKRREEKRKHDGLYDKIVGQQMVKKIK